MDHRSSCLSTIVDLERYPLHELTSALGTELIERCLGSLTETGGEFESLILVTRGCLAATNSWSR